MKCLSLKQPFTELLVSGKKTIELRKWNTKFRGKFLIYTKLSKRTAKELQSFAMSNNTKSKPEFVKVKNKHYEFWFKDEFMLRNTHGIRTLITCHGG